MPSRRRNSGQTIVFSTMALFILLGSAGLSIDLGYLRHERRMMQAAADSAAVAGAAEWNYGDGVAAAKADASTNGFTDGVNTVTISVNNPPQNGPNIGKSGYVEVIVSQTLPTFFMKALGITSEKVTARAVAFNGPGQNCIYALDPTGPKVMVVNGTAALTAQCGIIVDSNNPNAALWDVGSGCITATSIGIVGGYTDNSNCPIIPTPKTGLAPVSDPLAYVPAPAVGGCDYTDTKITKATTLSPGVYCNGIKITAQAVVTANPGTYILLGGGLSMAGGGDLQGSGVTFYNTGNSSYSYAPITLNGGSGTSLTAPTSGPLDGILFFQDRSISSTAQNYVTGNAGTSYQGALYFPTTPLTYSGGASGTAIFTDIVAYQLTFSGNSYFNDNTTVNNPPPIRNASLTE